MVDSYSVRVVDGVREHPIRSISRDPSFLGKNVNGFIESCSFVSGGEHVDCGGEPMTYVWRGYIEEDEVPDEYTEFEEIVEFVAGELMPEFGDKCIGSPTEGASDYGWVFEAYGERKYEMLEELDTIPIQVVWEYSGD